MDLARQVFNHLRRRDVGVWNALIGVMSNGCYREALDLFQDLEMDGFDPDETTLISTLTACRHIGDLNVGKKIHKCIEEKCIHGYAQDALDLYEEMLGTGLRPDGVTFVGVLCACSHAGLIDQGLHYFQSSMNTYKISPTAEHYGCIIDLLSRSGRLSEAYEIMLYEESTKSNYLEGTLKCL
ncbi:pentatricopeptide repeat-containing protein At4g18840-like [Papaver somniferum]|uniref:pentatricopeptide repeat-containing protein At4g18840-like n=1 Tax=Papaver somniferum TaxID=3469 RepID=UPI000E6F6DAE|nr:pentatricopeptide repeat-containing protein At4g18840-like [Papaver somniferum]